MQNIKAKLPAVMRRVAIGMSFVLLVLGSYQFYDIVREKQQREAEVMMKGNAEAEAAVRFIDAQLRKLEPLAKAIAEDLTAGRLKPSGIPARINEALSMAPDAFRMGAIFAPYAVDAKTRLYAPYVKRESGQLIPYRMESEIDYSEKGWYAEGMRSEGWADPHMSQTTHRLTVGYTAHFKLPGSSGQGPDGMVRIDFDMLGIDKIISELNLGRAGYGFVLGQNGVYMSHPKVSLVSEQQNIRNEAEGLDLASRNRIAQLASDGVGGYLKSVNQEIQLPIVVIVKPIPASKWMLGVSLILNDYSSHNTAARRALIRFSCTALVLVAMAGFVFLRVDTLEKKRWWWWISLVSVMMGAGVCLIWALTILYPDPSSDQSIEMMDKEDAAKYIRKARVQASGIKQVNLVEIPTGIYLQTLRLKGANDVVITGNVWQKHLAGAADVGFIFPDAEQSKITEMFRRQIEGGEMVLYDFKATIRQKSENNAKYPLDQAVLRIRLWPKVFGQQVFLTPDLDGYNILNPAVMPGVDQNLVLPGWVQVRSFFGYLERNYRTNFGLNGVVNSAGLPELCFDFVLYREFLGPFISNILPVFVVACIMFSLLMCGTRDKGVQTVNGFKTTDVLRGAATLVFPIMFAQINLRSKIAASDILYLEYFYFVMYAVILLVVTNILVFANSPDSKDGLVHLGDNVIPKLMYWPLLLGAFLFTSLWFLY